MYSIKADTPFSIGDDTIDPQLADYQRRLNELADALREGEIEEDEFRRRTTSAVMAAILLAFLLGGGDPESPQAIAALNAERQTARASIDKLARDISSGRYTPRPATDATPTTDATPGLTEESANARLRARLQLWGASLAGVYAAGQLNVPDPEATNYVWRLGNTVRHCADCLRLNGQVHTADEWRRAGIRPQSPDLECGGWNCDCRLEVTDKPSIGFEF